MTNDANNTHNYSPYIKADKDITLTDRAMAWSADHPFVVGTIGVLLIKNHNLKKRNREMAVKLREAKVMVDEARVSLEALGLFDYFFGPRPKK